MPMKHHTLVLEQSLKIYLTCHFKQECRKLFGAEKNTFLFFRQKSDIDIVVLSMENQEKSILCRKSFCFFGSFNMKHHTDVLELSTYFFAVLDILILN